MLKMNTQIYSVYVCKVYSTRNPFKDMVEVLAINIWGKLQMFPFSSWKQYNHWLHLNGSHSIFKRILFSLGKMKKNHTVWKQIREKHPIRLQERLMPVAKLIYALVLISVKSQSSPSACIWWGQTHEFQIFCERIWTSRLVSATGSNLTFWGRQNGYN